MPAFELTISLKQDGVPVPGFPLYARCVAPLVTGFTPLQVAALATETLPLDTYSTVTFFVLRVDQPADVLLAAPIVSLQQGGLLIAVSAPYTQAAGALAIRNSSSTDALNATGIAGGIAP